MDFTSKANCHDFESQLGKMHMMNCEHEAEGGKVGSDSSCGILPLDSISHQPRQRLKRNIR